jgi:hypothetical protein
MRKRFSFVIYLAIIFVVLSAIAYFIDYLIFRDIHQLLIYLVADLAFLPLEVLFVVVIIERLLARRETQAKLEKLNMVVGAFLANWATTSFKTSSNISITAQRFPAT